MARQPRPYRAPGSVGLLTAMHNAAPVVRGLLGAPTEDEGRQMGLLDQAFLAAHASGDRRGMAEAIGQQAALYGPNMLGAGIFAGVGAKTANKAALAAAEQMEKAGKAADDIWRQTGWGRGADGKWRFEIDDSAATFHGEEGLGDLKFAAEMEGRKFNPASDTLPLGGVVDHKDLYAAYPDAESITTRFMPDDKMSGSQGAYAQGNDWVAFSQSIDDGAGRATAIHEIQHAVQKREGFDGGGKIDSGGGRRVVNNEAYDSATVSRIQWDAKNKERFNELDNKIDLGTITKAEEQEWKRLAKELTDINNSIEQANPSPRDYYNRLSGEVEARNTQKRMNLDATQRRQTPPWATEDVPRDQQIVRRR